MEPSGQSGPAGGQRPDDDPNRPSSPASPPTWQQSPNPAPNAPSGAGGASNWTANLTSTAPVAGPAGYVYADVPNRIIAYIIDAILLAIIGFIVNLILGGIIGPSVCFNPAATNPNDVFAVNYGATLIYSLVNLVISGAYFVYTWTRMRASPGQRVLGMQVGNERDGATLTLNQALTRWVLLGAPLGLISALAGISGLGVLIALLGLIWFIVLIVTTAQSPTKQGLHDRYAHTVVVKAARSVA